MHAALQIEDIVQEIITFLDIHDLTALSSTSRSFYQPSKEAIWALQSNMRALVSLLPDDLVVPGALSELMYSMKEGEDVPFPTGQFVVLPRELKVYAVDVDTPPPSPVVVAAPLEDGEVS